MAVFVHLTVIIIFVSLWEMFEMVDNNRTNHLVIATAPYSFVVMAQYNDCTQTTSYSGLAFDIINHITAKFNLTYEIKLEKEHIFGVKLDNGSWNGMIGMVVDGEADLAANDFTKTEERAEVVEFSAAFSRDELTLMLQKPLWTPVGIFHPLDFTVWSYCVVCIMVIGLAMHSITVLSKVLSINTQRRTFLEYVLYSTAIQLRQGI